MYGPAMWFPIGGMGKRTAQVRDRLFQKRNEYTKLPEGPCKTEAEILCLDTREFVEFADPREAAADGAYTASNCRERQGKGNDTAASSRGPW